MKPSKTRSISHWMALVTVFAACLATAACVEKPVNKRPLNGMPNYSQNVGNLDTFGNVRTSNRAIVPSNTKSGSSSGN